MRERLLHKEIPRLLGVTPAQWVGLIRDELLVRAFPDRQGFAGFIAETLAPSRAASAQQELLGLLERELASVELSHGARSLLAFLKRRGYALGLLSNTSSVHKEPLAPLGLAESFAAMSFSCDEGRRKPEPQIYLDLCARLGAAPAATLMVGDSAQNDVRAPQRLGMRALRVAAEGEGPRVSALAELGWLSLEDGRFLQPLLRDGDSVTIAGGTGVLSGMRPLGDDDQGRYNLVASARVDFPGGKTLDVYCKRFLFPEAAHVDAFAHQVLQSLDMPSCHTAITEGPEPCLIVSKAAGAKLQDYSVDGPLAFEIGRHCALAYLFANADLRPRNAFLAREDGALPRITMIDLEHCFFNLAIDVDGLADPLDPATFDGMDAGELERRLQKKVLTERTTRRARRSFFETDDTNTEVARTFRDGWLDVYRKVQARKDEVVGLIEARVHRAPYLVIGTQSYRRAMAHVDVADISERIAQDPEKVFSACF